MRLLADAMPSFVDHCADRHRARPPRINAAT
jgi:hypothetical protein